MHWPTLPRLSRAIALVALSAVLVPMAQADSGILHRASQDRPILMGTSGGNINDVLRGGSSCQSGTLGALVQDSGGAQHILSNNHVLARTNKATMGEDINQPGLIDVSCRKIAGDVVGDLSAFVPIQFKAKKQAPLNAVDAARAAVRSGAVDPTGAIIDVGSLGAPNATDAVGCVVQKSGRTTGHTTGSISAVDVTVDVNYGNGNVARFTDQFLVTPGSFSAGGDSGSLIATVAAIDKKPGAVGLLFAGGSDYTVANPIDAVERALGVTMVANGTGTTCAETGATASGDQTGAASNAKGRHQDRLLRLPEAVGVGVGTSGAIEVYLARENAEARRSAPAQVDGIPVRLVVTGEFRAR